MIDLRRVLGFTLLEILLVIAVGATIVIISINYYAQVRREQKIDQFVQQVTSTLSDIDSYIERDGGASFQLFGNNKAQFLISSGVVKAEDLANVWSRGSYYNVSLSQPSDENCLALGFTVDLPSGGRRGMKPFCHAIQSKLIASFSQPGNGSAIQLNSINQCQNSRVLSFSVCVQGLYTP